ncbi:gas vesicle synthesis family protein [Halobacteriales archaeon QH_8_64_26]|nr:MAG: gas vesicle synthesis family protein [Halobacteriales archaeon QH_8_64_26]
MSETETERTSDRDTESSDGSTAEGGNTATTDASSEGDASLIDVRNTVLNTAADLIGRRLDGISGIQRTDEGWSAIVNVIERRSVPDTQDILGRYEITLESSGEIVGYHRLNRYRRGDTTQEEWE